MNLWRKVEEVIKPWMIVLGFVVLMMVGFCHEAKAEVKAEIGVGLLSGEYSKGQAGVLSERFGGGKYAVGMGVISRQEVTDRGGNFHKTKPNLFVFVQRRVMLGDWAFGLGPAYLNSTNRAIGSNFAAALSIEWAVSDHWSINVRHFSNAGSVSPNMGQDLLMIGYTF